MAGSERSVPRILAERFEAEALPHLGLLYRMARRLSRSAEDAEDLVQETYLKAFKGFATFEPRSFGIRPWLLRILHNTFLNRAKREQRAPRTADLEQAEQTSVTGSGGTGGPVVEIDLEQVDDEIRRALLELTPEYRSVVLLWATMEFGYQDMAEILELPVGTVMSRLHRARRQLRERLSAFAPRVGSSKVSDRA